MLKPLRFLLILTFVLNLFFSSGETVLVSWGVVRITREGLITAVHFCMRLIFLVAGTSATDADHVAHFPVRRSGDAAASP